LKKNILVGQSGGPTAVINASLYGIIKEAAAHSEQIGSVYGMINGIEGFLSGHIMDLKSFQMKTWNFYALHRQPTLVPAAISCLKIWMLPFTPFFLKNLNS